MDFVYVCGFSWDYEGGIIELVTTDEDAALEYVKEVKGHRGDEVIYEKVALGERVNINV